MVAYAAGHHVAYHESEGALQNRMRELTRHVLLALIVVIAVVSIWTPLGWQYVAERWFTLPNFFWFLPVPLLVGVFSLWIWRLTRNPASHARPFLLTLGLIFLGFSGLGISLWPNIIPPRISLWDAAAPPASQLFMLVGTLLIIPVIPCTPPGVTSFGEKFLIQKVTTEVQDGRMAYTGHYLSN